MKKILSLIFAVWVSLSSSLATVGFALAGLNVMRTADNFEFAKKCAEIVYLYSGDVHGSEAQTYGGTLRILGRTSDPSYNFRKLGADECVVGSDGRFLLQFNGYSSYKYAMNLLRSDARIAYAEPDAAVSVSSEYNGEGTYLSWGVEALGLDKYSQYVAENHTSESSLNAGVKVAIVDTGVQNIEPLGDLLVPGYDFVDNDSDAYRDTSDDSHGTFIAGIVADCTKDTGIRIMPIRVIESDEGYLSTVVNGIYYAVDNGADVINLSINVTFGPCNSLDEAVKYADEKDVVFVACSGNFRKDTSNVCPAHIDSAITVSAINEKLEFSAGYSDFGASVDVVAPGDYIVSYGADGNLKELSGTSMSAGFISAGAALFRAANPDFTALQVQGAIKNVCTDLGDEGFDIYYGNGIPDFSKLIGYRLVSVTDIEFADESITAEIGDEPVPDYVVSPSTATVKSVIFSSSNPEVAYVSNGKIICEKEGVATITATTVDGGFTDTVTVTVEGAKAPVPVGMFVYKAPDKTDYTYKSNEMLDLDGIQIVVTYSDSSTKIILNPVGLTAIDGFSSATAGRQTVTVDYEGFTDEFEITVSYTWWQMIIRILLLGFLWY